jgi:hypothetical protein
MPTCVICLEDEWTDSGEVITCVICTQAYHGECVRSGWVNRACASCRRGVLLLAVRPRDPSAAVEEPPLRRPRFDTKLLPLCCRHLGPPPDFQFLPVRSMRWCPAFRVFHCYGCNREVDPTLVQTYQTVRPSCTRHGSRTLVMDYHGGPLSDSFFTGWACTYETRDDMGGEVSEMVYPECQGVDTTYVVDVSDDDDAMVINDSDAQVDDGMMMMDALIAVANTMLTDDHHGDTIAVADTMILAGDESPAETIILPDDESSDDSVPDSDVEALPLLSELKDAI